MARGGEQHLEVMEEVVPSGKDIGMGRSKHAGVGEKFQDSGTCGYSIWFREVENETPHGLGPGGFPE